MRAARRCQPCQMDEPRYRVLCMPGGLCTAVFYDDLLATPALAAGGSPGDRLTLPGFGGVPFPAGFDASLEAYAAHAAGFARELDCNAIVGHSFGANIALEMAALGHFDGPLILLSPTFSAEDEMKGLATFNRIGYVPGLRYSHRAHVPELPEDARRQRSRKAHRATCHRDGNQQPHGHPHPPTPLLPVPPPAWDTRRPALPVRRTGRGRLRRARRGRADSPSEGSSRRPTTRLHFVPNSGHMLLNQMPDWVAELIVESVAR